jgi:hypothetical protein
VLRVPLKETVSRHRGSWRLMAWTSLSVAQTLVDVFWRSGKPHLADEGPERFADDLFGGEFNDNHLIGIRRYWPFRLMAESVRRAGANPVQTRRIGETDATELYWTPDDRQ